MVSTVWWVESTCIRDGYNYVTLHRSLDTALCPRHVLLISDYSMDIQYDVYLLSYRNEENGVFKCNLYHSHTIIMLQFMNELIPVTT